MAVSTLMHCDTGKICYRTEEDALEALIEHRAHFNHPANAGPINVYHCMECDYWHFTSKGNKHKLLKDSSHNSKSNILREASYWEGRFRR